MRFFLGTLALATFVLALGGCESNGTTVDETPGSGGSQSGSGGQGNTSGSSGRGMSGSTNGGASGAGVGGAGGSAGASSGASGAGGSAGSANVDAGSDTGSTTQRGSCPPGPYPMPVAGAST